MFLFRKKKPKYPEKAKYKIRDYVNFRYNNELYFGYIYMAYKDKETNKITYTIQIAGQCPSFIHNYIEEDIIGYKTN
jgi:hypothetical protein